MSPAADCSSRYCLKWNSMVASFLVTAAHTTCNFYGLGIDKDVKRNFRHYSNSFNFSKEFVSDVAVLVKVSLK